MKLFELLKRGPINKHTPNEWTIGSATTKYSIMELMRPETGGARLASQIQSVCHY